MSADSPAERAEAALETAIESVQSVDRSDTVRLAKVERQAVDEFASAIAEAVDSGLSVAKKSQYCGAFARETPIVNKTELKDAVDGHLAAENSQESDGDTDGHRRILPFLKQAVSKIVAVRSTDAKQSTLYRWHFDDEGHIFQVETGEPVETSHYSWRHLRGSIFDVAGVWCEEPVDEMKDDWPEIIGPFIQKRTEVEWNKGPRTCATEALQNHVHRSVAYATVEDMVDHHGVRIDDDPDDGSPSEIWIPNTEVSKVCDDHSISERALQVQLNADGYTVDRIGGVSETTFVHGDKFTYWVLSADFADVGSYEPEPESMADRFERQAAEDQTNRDTDDDEVGLIGTTEQEQDQSPDDSERDEDVGEESGSDIDVADDMGGGEL
jgi:hypothetical protein